MGVFTTDPSLVVRTWDPWLAAVTGISADAARGRPLTELVPDLGSRGLRSLFQQAVARGVVQVLSPALHGHLLACPALTGSGERMQQRVTIAPLRDGEDIVGTIVTVEDVTGRIERERSLAAALSDADPAVRVSAVTQLADAGAPPGPDPLLPAIGDDDWRVRRAAVQALSRRSSAEVIAGVLTALREDHRSFSVLSSAIAILSAGDFDVVEPLIEFLGGADGDLRLQAALLLGERGGTRAVQPLIDVLADPDENLRFHAIEALGKLKAVAASDQLTTIAESGEFFLAFPALEALAQIGDARPAPRLVPLLKDELLRRSTAEVLGRIGDDEVVGPLTHLLNDTTAPTEVVAEALASVYTRYEARYGGGEHIAGIVRRTIAPAGLQNLLDAVHRAAPDALPGIARVLAWLEGPAVERSLTLLLGHPSVRGKVIEYLVRQGERVVGLLIEQLQAEDLDTRHAAVVGLGRIGDRRATLPLLDVLANEPSLRVVTAGALARIGDRRAFEALLGFLRDPDPAVRQAVIAALNSIGHPAMAGRISPLLHDSDPHVRESAIRIAGYFGYPECADDLLSACRDEETAVRRAAVEHLAFLDDERVVETLLGTLEDEDAAMRAAAVQALGRVEDPRVLPPVMTALRDPDSWVRYFAARALGARRHAPAEHDLARVALDDAAGHVRVAAIDALGQIGSPAAIPTLGAIASAEDEEHAAAAVQALGGIRHPEVSPRLQAVLRAGGTARRAAAADAISRLGGAGAIELLEWTAAADSSRTVAATAIRGLTTLSADPADGPDAVTALVGLTADSERTELVIPALAAVPPAHVHHVAAGLSDPRVPVRVAVVQALGRMTNAAASQRIQTALGDAASEVRLAALAELRHLGTRGIEPRLVTIARADPDPAVRRAALAVLKAGSWPSGGNAGAPETPMHGKP